MNSYCYISMDSPNAAKRHVDEIARMEGFEDMAVKVGKGKVATFLRKLLSVTALMFRIHKGDVLLIQYPFKKFYVIQCRIAHLKGAKSVTLIHDLGTFRRGKLTAGQEVRRLSHTDVIIVHNQRMNDWLRDHGCKVPLVNLDIFDYLSADEPATGHQSGTVPSIVFAGGISRRKSAFIYEADSCLDGCRMDLYGSGLEHGADKDWKNIRYHGTVGSDEFIRTVNSDWGLVWDGDSVDGCSGVWGSYLRINNPHKTSFYLRAGLPVIVWKESAMAPFILDNKLGIAVGSLREIPEVLRRMTPGKYGEFKRAAIEESKLLNDGHYFKTAFAAAIETLTQV